jgi:hypothetical protein
LPKSESVNSPQQILLSIIALDSKPVEVRTVEKLQDQLVLPTSGYKPGLYFLTMKVNGKVIDTGKFTILH